MKTLFMLLLAISLNLAAEAQHVETFAELNWGEPVTGAAKAEVKPKQYKGKIVVVEEFGARIPDCIE
jgi:hypothetical protein